VASRWLNCRVLAHTAAALAPAGSRP